MLIVFLWLGSVLPERYLEVINDCESYPGNRCVILQQVHEKILLAKYKDLLHLSQPRLDSMIMVERTDILRLLYLYDKGGIYSDLDNKINYTCLENFIKSNNQTFYFGHEQFDPKKPSNNFIYAPTPKHPDIKRVIQKIHECERCTDLNFASPYFLNKIGVPFKVVNCYKHGYESTWYWTKHKYLKSPQQARWEAQQRANEDRAAAGDPAKQKALAEKRAKQKLQADKNFLFGQAEADKLALQNKALIQCQATSKQLTDQKNSLQAKIAQLQSTQKPQQPAAANTEKDKQLEQAKADKEKAQKKNIWLQTSLANCKKEAEGQKNCPKKDETQSTTDKVENSGDCQEKQEKTMLALIASSAALGALLLCNAVNCWKRRGGKGKRSLEGVANMESNRETNVAHTEVEDNSQLESSIGMEKN